MVAGLLKFRDYHSFIARLEEEPFDDNSLKTYRMTTEQVIERLESVFGI